MCSIDPNLFAQHVQTNQGGSSLSGKRWRSLASVALASLLPCAARADSSIAAQAVTDVVASFGTPPLVPQAAQPASDPPAPDPQPPRLPALVGDGAPTALTCDLCQTSRPAYRREGHTRRGVVITGAVIGGIGFGFAIAVAAEGSEGTSGWNGVPFDLGALALPVVGPWITLGTLKPNCGGRYGDEPGGCTRVHTQEVTTGVLPSAAGYLRMPAS